MAIYPDKRDGKLTGKFRVELQRGADRYRKRHETHAAAVADEKRVLGLWDRGEVATLQEASQAVPEAPKGMTILDAIEAADGILWRGSANAPCNYAHVRFLATTIGKGARLQDITTLKVREMIKALDKKGSSDATVNRYLSHIRTFLNWHAEEKNCPHMVADIVWDWRKEDKGRMRWLSFEEEDKLISLVPEKIGKLIKVAIETGCRREELLSVKADQIEDDTLHIWKTKNNEPRSVPITEETARLLQELVADRMPSARMLRRHWDAAKAKMGLEHDAEFVFHACRHTCATRMVDADIDILLIKEFLGHKRLETTQRYAKVKPKKLRSILDRVGELRGLEAANPSKPAVPHVTPTAPHGGGMGEMGLAA